MVVYRLGSPSIEWYMARSKAVGHIPSKLGLTSPSTHIARFICYIIPNLWIKETITV